jgi:hypothetical protein
MRIDAIVVMLAVATGTATCTSLNPLSDAIEKDVAKANINSIKKPTNFLMILADDTGVGDMGFNDKVFQPGAGGKRFIPNPPRTPNLDGWASGPGSMLFDRFYSGNPVCSPTR